MKYTVTYTEKKTKTIWASSMAEAERIARGVYNETTKKYEGGAWRLEHGFTILSIEKVIKIPPVDPTPAMRMAVPEDLSQELKSAERESA